MLFAFPQGCCLAFPMDVTYLSSGILFTFPWDVVCLFPMDVVYLSGMLFTFPHRDIPGMSFTFPQGESQAGSPGLLAFQSAKSRSDFLSPGFWLSSPVHKKGKHQWMKYYDYQLSKARLSFITKF